MSVHRFVETNTETLLLAVFEAIDEKLPFSVLEEALRNLLPKKKLDWNDMQNSTAFLSGDQLKMELGICNRRTDDDYYNDLDAVIIPNNYVTYARVECTKSLYRGMVGLARHLAQVNLGAPGFKWYEGKPAFFSGTTGTLRYRDSYLAVEFIWDILGGRLIIFKNRH